MCLKLIRGLFPIFLNCFFFSLFQDDHRVVARQYSSPKIVETSPIKNCDIEKRSLHYILFGTPGLTL
jgi:hypothetical protein